MVCDPTEPEVDMIDFPWEDWSYSIYSDNNEELPPMKMKLFAESGSDDMSEPRGIGFVMTVFFYYNLGRQLCHVLVQDWILIVSQWSTYLMV